MRDVSLSRALSKLGFTSRSLAKVMIEEGRVSVNGRVVKKSTFRCDFSRDNIEVDGNVVGAKKTIIIMLHKPRGIVTTRSDERGRRSIYDLLGEMQEWIFPVGRLDMESEGLILCTNDTALGEALTDPHHMIQKTYRVGMSRPLSGDEHSMITKGMILDGLKLRPVRLACRGKKGEDHLVDFTLVEGKNRQIRRMCSSFGIDVHSLARLTIGPLKLGNLKAGEYRSITPSEERLLRAAAGCPVRRTRAGRLEKRT